MLNVQESTQDVTSACKTTLFMVIILLPTMVTGLTAVEGTCDGFYTVSGANEKLKTLYKAPEDKYKTDGLYTESSEKLMPNLNKAKQFVKMGIYGNSSFLAYLNKTFPESKEVSEEDEESKKAYDEMKDGSKTNSSKEVAKDDGGGEEKEDDGKPKTDKYGYTYKNVKFDPFLENLPSLHPYPDEEGGSADDTTGITPSDKDTVDGDGDKINVSENTKNQTNIVSALFGHIGEALTAGRDNVYVMEYIFNNFSYNTRIQEAVVDGLKTGTDLSGNEIEKIDDGTIRASDVDKILNDETKYAGFKDKTKTLSNYPLNPDNNYLYGGEVEYILYGNQDSPSLNVTYAKASIYGVRFVLNGIYAFTNSDIRNQTQALGLAVQAATLGVVPYKAAQIVAQLALAAAESAIDLSQMEKGLSVAVVKTDETWTLSLNGVKNAVKELAKQKLEEVADEVFNKASEAAKDALKNVVNSTADTLSESVKELNDDLASATVAKGKELLDSSFNQLQNKFKEKLSELQFMGYVDDPESKSKSKSESEGESDTETVIDSKTVKGAIDKAFSELDKEVDSFGAESTAGDEIKTALVGEAQTAIKGWLTDIKEEIKSKIPDATDDIYTPLMGALDNAETALSEKVNEYIKDIYDRLAVKLNGVIEKGKDELTKIVDSKVDDAKDKIAEKTNKYLNEKLGDNSSVGKGISESKAGTKNNKTSVASMIKFGYKDYLKVFMFIGLCVNDDGILSRTGDVIQMNICNAGEESNLLHNKGEEFRLSNAKTYVSVKANVQTDMLFLNMGLFQDQITNYGGVVESEEEGFGLSQMTTLQYTGLFGY